MKNPARLLLSELSTGNFETLICIFLHNLFFELGTDPLNPSVLQTNAIHVLRNQMKPLCNPKRNHRLEHPRQSYKPF